MDYVIDISINDFSKSNSTFIYHLKKMLRPISILLILVTFNLELICDQNIIEKLDSLESHVNMVPKDTNDVRLLADISYEYASLDATKG